MTLVKMDKPSNIQINTAAHSSGSFPAFHLSTPNLSYRFHVSSGDAKHVVQGVPIPVGELIHDHFGAPAPDTPEGWQADVTISTHEPKLGRTRRELPDSGRGDFRLPAIHLRHAAGHTVSAFLYEGYEIKKGKVPPPGLPGTFSSDGQEAETLVITLKDKRSGVKAKVTYGVFGGCDAITRSVTLRNEGETEVEIERLASLSADLGVGEWEMVQLAGDWAREGRKIRRKVYSGTQGFQSSAGYSSHFHNPFVALVHPSTTETTGEAYGFNLVYTGSHSTEIEQAYHGYTRVLMGLNPLHLSWKLAPGESFTTPEAVAVYTADGGLGGMSRAFHRLYRNHLSRSEWTFKERPTLLNNWEGTYFDFDAKSLYPLAEKSAKLGAKLFVMDDGWFGKGETARTDDLKGLGDWFPNPEKFPEGLDAFVRKVNALDTVRASNGTKEKMHFGIWVEPEMVNAKSELYSKHPDWVLHAADHDRSETRNQLVLDLGKKEVQDYIIDMLSTLLSGANITYIKWDNNRCMHELPSPSAAHKYMLGLYRVLDTLTSQFSNVLWEGCASGGGRFDAGILHYFPQTWTSDDTDAYERLFIQFGTSIVYPPSSMGCHVSAVPNHQTYRVTPLTFRAHVAMMGGSFGFELDPLSLSAEEQEVIPSLIELGERVNPFVINGDQYKLALPEETNWPAAMYVKDDKSEAVLLAYQCHASIKMAPPNVVLQGLDKEARYEVEVVGGKGRGDETNVFSGKTLMGAGLRLQWMGDFQSRVIFLRKV